MCAMSLNASQSGNSAQSSAVALFPWSSDSLKDLWPDRPTSEENQPAWDALIQEWAGACAVGYSGEIAIYGLQIPLRSIAVKVPVVRENHLITHLQPLTRYRCSELVPDWSLQYCMGHASICAL